MNRQYRYPSEVEIERLRNEADKRRDALAENGCSTYTTGFKGNQQAIVCLCCGLSSSNPGDLQHKYCCFCQKFHSESTEGETSNG